MWLQIGKIAIGIWPGSTFISVTRAPNSDPKKCFTETVVTILDTDVAVYTIIRGDQKITCFGKFDNILEPGINNN